MALLSNVWYNLTNWASGTFTTGQYRASSSNVYICTTGGTGSIAPSGTGFSISGGGTVVWSYVSSYDYTNLQSWGNAIASTPTQAYIVQVGTGSPGTAITTTLGTPFLSLSGHATTSTNSITVQAFPGQGFATFLTANPGTALAASASNGILFQIPSTGSSPTNYFDIIDDFVTFSGLQIQDINTSGSNSTLINSYLNFNLNNCIIDGYPQVSADLLDGGIGGSGVTKYVNCVIIDRSPATSGSTLALTKIRNNFVVSCTTILGVNLPVNTAALFNVGGSSFTNTVIDSVILGYPAGFTVGSNSGGLSAISYTVISAASITSAGVTTGSGMQYSKTAASQVVSGSSSPNLRLIGTATAINGGTPDLTNNPSSVDILGTVRPVGGVWDAGAYEAPSTAVTGTANGHASVSGMASSVIQVIGTANGQATVLGAANSQLRSGTAAGQASVSGAVSTTAVAFGTANGQANVFGFYSVGSLTAIITINPIPAQPPNTAFVVSGTYTIYPTLQFSDDNTGIYTSVGITNTTPLGTQQWSFLHPGEGSPGPYQLTVSDSTTNISVAATFLIIASSAPSSTGAIGSGLFPPSGPTGLITIIPSYLYEEYADDDNLQAFVQAQNLIAQSYLVYLNSLNLPIYTQLSGSLLDWVASGLYGMIRPNLSTSTSNAIGPFNTYEFDTTAMAVGVGDGTTTVFNVTDDLFKRMITWNFYKNDGFTFNTSWLKRRVMRFLGGTNGIDYGVSETYQVSVQFIGLNTINITIHVGTQPVTYVPILAAAINASICQLPFLYTYNVLQS